MSTSKQPEHRASFTLAAPPDRVFAALTDPGELRTWFAEFADVEPRVGGRYRFWGRHTFATRDERAARQEITRFEPGRALAYRWDWEACPTTVEIELESLSDERFPDGGSKVKLRHAFDAALTWERPADLVDDHWRLVFGNLMGHLAGDGSVLLPDYTDPAAGVCLSIEIGAPPAKVFRALLDPDQMNKWIASAAVVEPKAGGRYSYGWSYDCEGRKVAGGPTRILELVENRLLVTDWPDWRGRPGAPKTRVSWTLEPVGPGGGRTRLTLTHTGFPRAVDRSDYQQGWMEFTTALKRLVENA